MKECLLKRTLNTHTKNVHLILLALTLNILILYIQEIKNLDVIRINNLNRLFTRQTNTFIRSFYHKSLLHNHKYL